MEPKTSAEFTQRYETLLTQKLPGATDVDVDVGLDNLVIEFDELRHGARGAAVSGDLVIDRMHRLARALQDTRRRMLWNERARSTAAADVAALRLELAGCARIPAADEAAAPRTSMVGVQYEVAEDGMGGDERIPVPLFERVPGDLVELRAPDGGTTGRYGRVMAINGGEPKPYVIGDVRPGFSGHFAASELIVLGDVGDLQRHVAEQRARADDAERHQGEKRAALARLYYADPRQKDVDDLRKAVDDRAQIIAAKDAIITRQAALLSGIAAANEARASREVPAAETSAQVDVDAPADVDLRGIVKALDRAIKQLCNDNHLGATKLLAEHGSAWRERALDAEPMLIALRTWVGSRDRNATARLNADKALVDCFRAWDAVQP